MIDDGFEEWAERARMYFPEASEWVLMRLYVDARQIIRRKEMESQQRRNRSD